MEQHIKPQPATLTSHIGVPVLALATLLLIHLLVNVPTNAREDGLGPCTHVTNSDGVVGSWFQVGPALFLSLPRCLSVTVSFN